MKEVVSRTAQKSLWSYWYLSGYTESPNNSIMYLGMLHTEAPRIEMKMACVWDYEERGLTEAEGRTGNRVGWKEWLQIAHELLSPKVEIGLLLLGITESVGL